MEIKKIEKSDLVLFPRLQEQGVEARHVVVNIQFADDEADFYRKLKKKFFRSIFPTTYTKYR